MTEWFDRKAGESGSISQEDPTMVLIGDQTPDWVRLPEQLGGERLQVKGSFVNYCPMCSAEEVKHLLCEGDYGVAECPKDGFVWYRVRP